MDRLKEAILSVTNRCNSNCRMCDIPSNKIEELTTAQWKQVIKDAALIGAETVVFSGGEPLLREDIFELIFFAKNNRVNACLTSNGLLIDDKIAFELSRAKVDVVNISIEGPEEVHDYLRGSGSFRKALSALKSLKANNIESTIATMVSRHNYFHLPFIVELAREHQAGTVRFQPFSEIFMKENAKEENFLIEKEKAEEAAPIMERVIELCARHGIASNPASYLRKIPFYLNSERVFPQHGCNALWNSCPVNARGEVFPCWVMTSQDKILGKVTEESLFEAWTSERRSRILESIVEKGCPGCMMSCYDKAFGRDEPGKFLSEKAAKIGNIKAYGRLLNRVIQFNKREALRLKLRYNYYRSSEFSFSKAFGRVSGNARRRIKARAVDSQNEIEKTLSDSALLKERLKKELARYR